jgi:hypothetical protein
VNEDDLPPGTAAELRLLRAEIAALRSGPPPCPWVHHRQWAPEVSGGHVILPARHYRALKAVRGRLRNRAPASTGPVLIARQRHRAMVLLLFGAIRIAAWTVLGVLVACGLAGVSAFSWARTLAESLPFIALISIYANWATDLDGATAAFAALVASDVHHDVVATGLALAADLDELETDVARLADLDPGEEATRLAGDIRRRLARVPATAAGQPKPAPGKPG